MAIGQASWANNGAAHSQGTPNPNIGAAFSGAGHWGLKCSKDPHKPQLKSPNPAQMGVGVHECTPDMLSRLGQRAQFQGLLGFARQKRLSQ